MILKNPTDKVLKWKLEFNTNNKGINSLQSIGVQSIGNSSNVCSKGYKDKDNTIKLYF